MMIIMVYLSFKRSELYMKCESVVKQTYFLYSKWIECGLAAVANILNGGGCSPTYDGGSIYNYDDGGNYNCDDGDSHDYEGGGIHKYGVGGIISKPTIKDVCIHDETLVYALENQYII